MSQSRWYSIVIDCIDLEREVSFWQAVLGYERVYEADDEIVLATGPDAEPGLVFVQADEPKTVKDPIHIDLAPDDQDAEVERIIGLGATRADIGQHDVPWVVLRSPEGHEFCVLTAR